LFLPLNIEKQYKYLCVIVGMTDNDKQNMIDKSNYLEQLTLDVKNGTATERDLLKFYGQCLISSVEVNGHQVMSNLSKCINCGKMHQEHEHKDCPPLDLSIEENQKRFLVRDFIISCKEEKKINKLNQMDDYDFYQELGGYFYIEKNNDYDFKLIKGNSWYNWDYSVRFYMEDGEEEFSFEVEINEEKKWMEWCPDENNEHDIEETIEEWGEYKPEHLRAFVWSLVFGAIA